MAAAGEHEIAHSEDTAAVKVLAQALKYEARRTRLSEGTATMFSNPLGAMLAVSNKNALEHMAWVSLLVGLAGFALIGI